MSRLSSARVGLALWILTRAFPVLSPRCGRPSRGLRAGRRARLVAWVPASGVPLVGVPACRLAFRLLEA